MKLGIPCLLCSDLTVFSTTFVFKFTSCAMEDYKAFSLVYNYNLAENRIYLAMFTFFFMGELNLFLKPHIFQFLQGGLLKIQTRRMNRRRLSS